MDGIANNLFQKKCIFFIVQFFILFSIKSTEIKMDSLSLLNSEVDYDYNKMIDAEKDQPTIEGSYEYSMKIIDAEKEFLKSCGRIKKDESIMGEWNLLDSNGNSIEKHSYYFNNRISISEYNNEIVLDNWGNRSFLYLGEYNRYYIFSRGIGIIRMIKIKNNKLYVYIIIGGKWVLDPIHAGGKYLYVKQTQVK